VYHLDYDHVIGFGNFEFSIFIKLLKNEELTDAEEDRIEQMLKVAISAKKVKENRARLQRQRDGSRIPRSKKQFEVQ
jgi:hypothetical protein